MPVCDFIKTVKVKDDDGSITEERSRCINKVNVREVEFKHAEYREQNSVAFLCESHFSEVFGDIDDEEKKSFRDWQNAKFRYNRDYANARKHAEYFEMQTFKDHSYPPVQKAYDKWASIRKQVCRYEGCDIKLNTIKRVFVIRIYTQTGREWTNYYFCCKEHWQKMKYRIGIEQPNVEKEIVKSKSKTLDDYS